MSYPSEAPCASRLSSWLNRHYDDLNLLPHPLRAGLGTRCAEREQQGERSAAQPSRSGATGLVGGGGWRAKRGHLNVLEPDREDSCAQGDAGGCVGLKARAISTVRGLIARCAKRERQGERSAVKPARSGATGWVGGGGLRANRGHVRALAPGRTVADPVTLTSRTGMTTLRASTMPAENAMREARAERGEAGAKRSHRAGGWGEQWAHECPRARRRGSVA